MKQQFSIHWKSSKQPRKQRKYRYNAPMHVRQKLVRAHLEKALRKEYGRRSLAVRKGDEVKIMTGRFRGTHGKVSRVDMKSLKIYMDNAKVKKVSGQEVEVAIDPSNIMITKLELDDKKRRKFIARKKPRMEQRADAKDAKGKTTDAGESKEKK